MSGFEGRGVIFSDPYGDVVMDGGDGDDQRDPNVETDPPFWPEVDGIVGWELLVKRTMDVAGALVALVVLGPLLLVVALIIRLTSPGPVLFRQEREGKGGRIFTAYKFRSMYANACDLSGVQHTAKDDPRVTHIGRFIRRTSIDELPQLFNVLAGEMSLVGPRPHVPGMLAAGRPYSVAVPYYRARYAMLPGITGWAQVNGARGRIETIEQARRRVDFDIAYARDFSLLLDLRILWMTLRSEFFTGSGE